MGYAPFYGASWKGDLLVANVGELQEDDVSDVYLRRIETKVLVSKEGDIFIIPFFERFCKVDRKKVLKSNHPTEFGKTSKKEKNTAVIFKERLTNPRFCRATTGTRQVGSKVRFLEHIWKLHFAY